MKLPDLKHLTRLKNKITSFIFRHRILLVVLIVASVSVIAFVTWAIRLRSSLLTSLKSSKNDSSNDVYYSAHSESSIPNFDKPPSFDESVSSSPSNDPLTVPTPYPIDTLIPTPTDFPESTTTTTTNTSSNSSCVGKPTVDNSQAYLSSSSTVVNSAVTITVELLDCNDDYAPVNDNLTITLSNNDSSARINGSSSPVTVQAQNGKASFTVNSQNAGTDTFVISDTSNSFTVTTPGYHNPSVTFSSNSSGNSNCTTGAGVPNSWFSDVYPASPVAATVGSPVTFTVDIRDCNKNTTSNDTLNISLSSGDASTQVNSNNLPYSITTQNGQASFTVNSQIAATDTLVIQDTTSSFSVTDTYNNNPSVVFSGSSSTTPTPAVAALSLSCGANPVSASADGSSVSKVTLQLKDGSGNTINNQSSVTVSSSDSTNSISGNPFTTDGNGKVSFSITSTNPGQPTFTVSENGSSATTNCVTFTQAVTPTPALTPTPTSTPTVTSTPTPTPTTIPTPIPTVPH